MLAIAGGKGGSGKTTTTLGLAAALDGPAVAVDADQDMPDLHVLADVDRSPTLEEVASDRIHEAAQSPPGFTDVSVVPAPRGTDGGGRLAAALDRLSRADLPVLVDCPAGAGPDAAAALRAADAALLVSTLCAPSLRDAAKTAAMARAVGTPPVGAVLTRCRTVPDAAADLLDCPVLATTPPVEPPVLRRQAVKEAHERVAASVIGRTFL